MTPWATGNGWELYKGDSMSVLDAMRCAGREVSAVITDPPYSSGGMVRGDRMSSARKKYANSDSATADQLVGFTGDNRDQRSYLTWCALWLSICLDIAEQGAPVVAFTDWRQLPTTTDALQSGGWVWRGIVPWAKPTARPQMGRFAGGAEFFAWGTNGPSLDLEEVGCLPGWYVAPVPRADVREHITQKPVELMQHVVKICRMGGTVLDPFCGSGTTGVAALLEGRSFIGIEREEAHLETSARRLTDAAAGVPERDARRGTQAGLFSKSAPVRLVSETA
jgi:site-specific DNA-methyltransferase (adenine-specific)